MIRQLLIALIFTTVAALPVGFAQVTPAQGPRPGFVNTLMPQPSQLATQEGRMAITPSFSAVTDHFRDARLDAALARSLGRIESRTGVSIPRSPASDATSAALVVSVDGAGETI